MRERDKLRFDFLVGKIPNGLTTGELNELIGLFVQKLWSESQLDQIIATKMKGALSSVIEDINDMEKRICNLENGGGPQNRSHVMQILHWIDSNKNFILIVVLLVWLAADRGIHLGDEVRRFFAPSSEMVKGGK